MERPIVTLTTDWGNQGFFAGMVKGLLYSMVPGVQVVDITHHIELSKVLEASFVVKHGCLGFPAGTIHIVDVGGNPLDPDPFVAVRARGQYFVCCNNGLPAMVLGNEVEEAVSLPMQANHVYNFAAYSLMAPAAARLANGDALAQVGTPLTQLSQRMPPRWIRQGDQIHIPIMYIDSYGNAYLGMSYREFEEEREGRPFVLQARDLRISEIRSSYHTTPSSTQLQAIPSNRELCLTVSSTGMLELAIPNSSFARMVGMRLSEMVLLTFR